MRPSNNRRCSLLSEGSLLLTIEKILREIIGSSGKEEEFEEDENGKVGIWSRTTDWALVEYERTSKDRI